MLLSFPGHAQTCLPKALPRHMLDKPYFNFFQPSGTRLRYSRDPYGFGDPWEVCCAKRDDTENPEAIDRRGQRRSLHPPLALLPGLATTSRVVCTFGRSCATSTRRWLSRCGAHQDFGAGFSRAQDHRNATTSPSAQDWEAQRGL